MTAPDKRPLPDLPPRNTVHNVHVIGVCGTAMGSLAAMFQEGGLRVTGSDAMAYPPMSTWLQERGIVIQDGYKAAHIPHDTDLVIVGNVARRDNPEVLEAARRELPALSLPEALRAWFFPGHEVAAVTGTHGKTTTSSMLAWILHQAEQDPSFFIGGVTANFSSNYRLGQGKPFVIEGDEYDTAWFDKVPKFWHYPATVATINNVEFDHADIYPDLASIEHVFKRFAAQIPPNGTLWVNGDDPVAMGCAQHASARVRSFGLGDHCELRGEILRTSEEGLHTTVTLRGEEPVPVLLPLIGEYSLRNFLGAAALAMEFGVSLPDSAQAIRSFLGVKKRQELKGIVNNIIVIDDFAHHPTAVRGTLEAMRERYPTRRIWAVFEAKSNTSRRAVFQDDYPPAFALADHVILSQPWRQDSLPEDQKISIPRMVEDIQALGVDVELIPEVPAIVEYLAAQVQPGDLILGLSGSSFGGLHDLLLEALQKRFG